MSGLFPLQECCASKAREWLRIPFTRIGSPSVRSCFAVLTGNSLEATGFRAWGLGFRVWGLGFRVTILSPNNGESDGKEHGT